MNKLLVAAYKFLDKGICVIPANNEKRAFLPWKKYQDTMISMEEAEVQFEDNRAQYIAVVCGKASGNLEVVDVDTKYDISGTLWKQFSSALADVITDENKTIFDKLFVVQTRSGGYHLYYRCKKIEGNQPLARRSTTEEEKKADPRDLVKVLIETRGHGGYVIAPPSKGYKYVSGDGVQEITENEREIILEIARSFNQLIEQPNTNHTAQGYNPKEYGLSPFEDYNRRGDVLGLLQQHGWKIIKQNSDKVIFRRPGKDEGTSGDYLISKQWFSVFTTSSCFEPNKAYLPYAVYCMLECNGDYKKCAKHLLQNGYGEAREYFNASMERKLYRKKQEGLTNDELAKYIETNFREEKGNPVEIVEKLNRQWGEVLCTFWDVDEKMKVSINRGRLINFLFNVGGFSLYYYDVNSTIFRIVRCTDGFLEEVSTEHIKKFLKNYIERLPDTFDGGVTSPDLIELILKGSDTFFSKGILEFLNRGEFDFLKDTATEAFFPFKNGVVRVTKGSIDLLSYKEIKKVIWKSQIIDYDVQVDIDGAPSAEYGSFVNLVSGENDERFSYACTLIGYLLHKHKDFARPYAVILAEETDNENEGGGTGKGIFITALAKFINTERVDGKNFKLDKNFAFQRVGLDTKLVAIEDCRRNVDFEGFYSIITEGITVEKKNKDELFIPYKDSPKIMFTTNYTISSVGNHAKRRQRVFEFSNFFSASNTPKDHFGHNLFDEWDKDEWNRFYNFGFICVREYLNNGILVVDATEKIKRKHIKLKYTEQFLEWWDEYVKEDRRKWRMAADVYASFLNQYDLDKKEYPQQKFGRALNEVADILSAKVIRQKNRQSGNKIMMVVLCDGEKTIGNVEDNEVGELFGEENRR